VTQKAGFKKLKKAGRAEIIFDYSIGLHRETTSALQSSIDATVITGRFGRRVGDVTRRD